MEFRPKISQMEPPMQDCHIFETLLRFGFDEEQVACALDSANNDIK